MNLAIVAANNHYAGFGPGTVNMFRNMMGLPEAKWEEKEMGIEKQEEQYPTQTCYEHDCPSPLYF